MLCFNQLHSRDNTNWNCNFIDNIIMQQIIKQINLDSRHSLFHWLYKNEKPTKYQLEQFICIVIVFLIAGKIEFLKMVFSFALVFCILHSVQLVSSQKGEFASFGEASGDIVISKNTPNFLGSGRPRRIVWELSKSFKAFGKNQTSITVSIWICKLLFNFIWLFPFSHLLHVLVHHK